MPQLIIQPSGADNYIYKHLPDTNYGTSDNVAIGKVDVADGELRNLIKFNFSALPNEAEIIATSLMAFVHTIIDAGRTLWAYRLTRTDWTEAGSTWNNYKAGSTWTTAGGDYTTTSGASVSGPAVNNWATWNVLAQAQYAQINTSKIIHFLLKDGTETQNKYSFCYSKNYTTDTTLCPKLILTWRYKNGLWFGHA